jgi:chondroitin AC lyase
MARGATTDDLSRIRGQFRDYCLSEAMGRGDRLLDDVEVPKSLAADANKYLDSMNPDGSWPDVNYQSQDRSAWRPYDHLTRLLSMITFALTGDNNAGDANRMLQAVHRGLHYWAANDFQCPNWWYNQIGVPKALGTIGLLLGDQLTDTERHYITTVALARSKLGGMTGQNREWLTGNALMRGLLTNNSKLVADAAAIIWEELRISNAEGLQIDNSFHQHGPQLQFGNYGMAYAVEICRWATVLRGTPMGLSAQKLSFFRNYLLNGENWVIWHGVMDISSCGRQLFPHSPRSKGSAIAAVMAMMPQVDPDHADQYTAFLKRNATGAVSNDLLGNRIYWRSDYAIERGSSLMFSVRMHSPRTIGGEMVNSENLSGPFLADGATYTYRTGDEYADIFPLWNWRRLPGVTGEETDAPITWPNAIIKHKEGYPGMPFVGGASDGNGGVVAMDFARDSLAAHKAWFFKPDQLICLGSDIHCESDNAVETTINQCLLHGVVELPGGEKVGSGNPQSDNYYRASLRAGDAIEHDGIRYTSLADQSWRVSMEHRTGQWSTVFTNPNTPRNPVQGDVLTIAIPHDAHPQNATYAYAISPSAHALPSSLAVLANSSDLQAITEGDLVSVIFWKPGKLETQNGTISADQPCVLMADLSRRQLTVADPTQKLDSVTVILPGTVKKVLLPGGEMAGSSVSAAF